MEILIKRLRRDWDLYLMFLPVVIWFVLFMYRPMWGLQVAFKDYNLFKGIEGSDWIGMKNFADFISSPDFFRTIKNTLLLSLYRIVICFPAPVILALMINEIRNGFVKKTLQTVTFLPYFISSVVVAGIAVNFLAPSTGIINIALRGLGLSEQYFLVKPEYFRGIFSSIVLWRETGFSAIVYIAALVGIDQELYNAAKVDGANRWQQLTKITIPSILPTIVIMFVLNIGKIVKQGFEMVLLIYQPATYETSDILGTYIYRTGLQNQNFGMATAAGLFEALVALLLVVISNQLSKKMSESSLW